MDLKEVVQNFQSMIVKGQIDEAYEKYVAKNFRHHNAYNKGDRESLLKGMKENHEMFPHKKFTVKKIMSEGNQVVTFSHIQLKPEDKLGVAVMHIFRFENGMIAELWDVGSPIPENLVNENGVF